MTDPITDMLNQIRSAKAVAKQEVSIPFSKVKYEIAKILMQENFIGEVKTVVKGKVKTMKIVLKYDNGVSKILDLKRVSKPGQRIYAKVSEIKKLKLGGEILCEVW